jgi:glutamate--cysteine ligase
LSGAQVETVHQTSSELMAHLAQVREVAQPLRIGFLGIGMTPSWTRAEMPKMPKGRYKIMTAYMPKVGKLGLDMMYRTCTVQTNLDFSSEADMVKKLRVSIALQPVATALFANSPFTEGKPNGFLSFRSEIWRDTDNARAGMLPWAFEPGMGFERWVDYALDVPMYFVKHGDEYVDVAGSIVPRSVGGQLPAMPASAPRSPIGRTTSARSFRRCGSSAIWKCAAPIPGRCRTCWRCRRSGPAFFMTMSASMRPGIWSRTGAPKQRQNSATPCRNKVSPPRLAAAPCSSRKRRLKLARAGLGAPQRFDAGGQDETRYLEVLEDRLARGTTPAQELLEKFHGRGRLGRSDLCRRGVLSGAVPLLHMLNACEIPRPRSAMARPARTQRRDASQSRQ